jgi:hypothetical protein
VSLIAGEGHFDWPEIVTGISADSPPDLDLSREHEAANSRKIQNIRGKFFSTVIFIAKPLFNFCDEGLSPDSIIHPPVDTPAGKAPSQ